MAFSSKERFLDSSTLRSLGSPPSTHEIIVIDDDEDEEVVTLEPEKKKPRLGSWWDNVEPFDELACVVKGPPEAKEDNDVVFSSTDLQETETKMTNDKERSGTEKSTTRNKGFDHVTLEDLGVSKEDLKTIPWESFDLTWEIRSDPWLSGYLPSL